MPFPAIFDLSTLDGSNGFRVDGVGQGSGVGGFVSSAGDINGDGIADILLGGYVLFGSGTGFNPSFNLNALDGSNGFRLLNGGRASSSAGDVNGDGFDDIIVGNPDGTSNNGSYAGISYVLFGSGSGFGETVDLSALDGRNGFRIEGAAAFDMSGYAVSSAGDFNGDGFDDIIIGAVMGDNAGGERYTGESYVVFGAGSGFVASIDLATLDGSNGFRLDGIDRTDRTGSAVSLAGDVNGDGFDDIIIGAYRADPDGIVSAGESYVVFGSASTFTSSFGLASLNGSNGFRIDGADLGDGSGLSVFSAGDVNGDGFADIIIGAPYADRGNMSDAGRSYVVFGSGTGFQASIDLSSLNGSNGFRLDGVAGLDFSGRSVSSAGDINADGFDDIIIGAPSTNQGAGSAAGQSYVVYGRASGFAAIVDLAALDGNNGFRIDGLDEGDYSGRSVSSAGDVNGDGIEDFIIGAPGADLDDANFNAGEAFVIYGVSPGFGPGTGQTIRGGAGDDMLTGTALGDRIFGFDGDDTIDAGAGDDLVFSGGGEDIVRGEEGDDTINGGADADTLSGNGGDDLILASGGDDRVDGGEGFDRVNGGGGNDTISGGADGDVLFGAADNDLLLGGAGNDTINAGSGNDDIVGGIGNNRLYGSSGDDRVTGGDDADSLNGATGNDTLNAGASDDVVLGVSGDDVLNGGAGRDTLVGGTGNDTIDGGTGDDNIFGQAGADRLTGGAGVDIFFVFNADESAVGSEDSILDFSRAEGDTIHLVGLNNEVSGGGSLSFAGNAFSGTAGEVIVTASGQVQVDLDGDSAADVAINIASDAPLIASDFAL